MQCRLHRRVVVHTTTGRRSARACRPSSAPYRRWLVSVSRPPISCVTPSNGCLPLPAALDGPYTQCMFLEPTLLVKFTPENSATDPERYVNIGTGASRWASTGDVPTYVALRRWQGRSWLPWVWQRRIPDGAHAPQCFGRPGAANPSITAGRTCVCNFSCSHQKSPH